MARPASAHRPAGDRALLGAAAGRDNWLRIGSRLLRERVLGLSTSGFRRPRPDLSPTLSPARLRLAGEGGLLALNAQPRASDWGARIGDFWFPARSSPPPPMSQSAPSSFGGTCRCRRALRRRRSTFRRSRRALRRRRRPLRRRQRALRRRWEVSADVEGHSADVGAHSADVGGYSAASEPSQERSAMVVPHCRIAHLTTPGGDSPTERGHQQQAEPEQPASAC